jgi:hypothetical protein
MMFLDLRYHQKSPGLGTEDSSNLENQEQKDHTQAYQIDKLPSPLLLFLSLSRIFQSETSIKI